MGRNIRIWAALHSCLLLILAACAAPPATPTQPAQSAVPAPSETVLPATATPAVARRSTGQEEGQSAPFGEGSVDLYAQSALEFPDDLEWLNTDQPLTIAGLRGKLILLDFWTYGCINCLHNFPELKRLEAEYPNELVVIGVHSGKFTNERETENIRQVIVRYGLDYPVINDKNLTIWNLWNVRAWPTLVLVDPSGTLAGLHVGEGVYRVFKPLINNLIIEAENRGRLDRTPLQHRLEREGMPATVLSFPGKILADPAGGRLFIADTNHNRIVIADPETGDVLDVIGSRQREFRDGDFASAGFATPQGMALAPDGRTLYIADSGNHAIRRADLEARTVTTLAGTGAQARMYPPVAGIAPDIALSSPWDMALGGDRLYIAMAGSHQIWALSLASQQVMPFAGSSHEGTTDGPRLESDLAQPSGLALDGAGRLYFADSESSSIRWTETSLTGSVGTLAGGGRNLFSFGDLDGVGRDARLQHPLSVAFAGGMLYIADTYNNKIKRIDPQTGAVQTIAGGEHGWQDGPEPRFYEPSGLSIAGGKAYIADTNNHAVRVLDLATGTASTLVLKGIERFNPSPDDDHFAGTIIELEPAAVTGGAGQVRLAITLPDGYKVNDQAPSAVTWHTDANAVTLPADADRSLAGLSFPLDLPASFTSDGTLTADLTVIYCKAITPDLCLIEEVRLVAPFTLADGAPAVLELRHEVVLES